jgi:hypothetical protein
VSRTSKPPIDRRIVGVPVGLTPGSYSGYCLASGSAGKHTADDGTDAGITGVFANPTCPSGP